MNADAKLIAELRAENEALRKLLQEAQGLRPHMLASFGFVTSHVLDYCNRARAALAGSH